MTLDTLRQETEYYLMLCRQATNKLDQRIMSERAFGAIQHHFMLFPQEQSKVEQLWDTYKPKFEQIIFGK